MSTTPHRKQIAKSMTDVASRNADTRVANGLNAKLDLLNKDILPLSPYILRLQQSHGRSLPRTGHSYFWMQGTPFSREEQELQYMSFRRPQEGLLHAHGQWDDGDGNIAKQEVNESRASSGNTPVHGQSTKKKISLADYKSRDTCKTTVETPRTAEGHENMIVSARRDGGGNTGVSAQTSRKISEAVIRRPNQVSGIAEQISDSNIVTTEPGSPDRKRINFKADKISEHEINGECTNSGDPRATVSKPTEEQSIREQQDTERDRKRSLVGAMTDTRSEASKTDDVQMSGIEDPDTKKKLTKSPKLPPILSPTLPDITRFRLPPLLSPTLPPEIEAAIAEAQANRPGTSSSSKPEGRLDDTKHVPSTKDATISRSQESRSHGMNDKATYNGITNQSQSRTLQNEPAKSNEPTRLWITLKIRKKSRSQLNQYLRLKPTPEKVHWRREEISRGTNGERPQHRSSTPKKRERSDEDEAAKTFLKRRRGSDLSRATLDAAGQASSLTPNVLASSPPPPPATPMSVQKSKGGAPTSHPAGESMRRAGSGQGSASTPSRTSRNGTPSVMEKDSPTNARQELKNEYRAESNKLAGLARSLKHDSDKYLKLDDASEDQQKLGIAIATESILCFILAALLLDEPSRRDNQAGNLSQWRSILPLLVAVARRARQIPHLYGLLQQLEGIMRDTIHSYESITLRNLVREHARVDLNEQTSSSALKRYQMHLKDSLDNEQRALVAWREGGANLWISDLCSDYPHTWKRGQKRPDSGNRNDNISPRDYRREEYVLPLGQWSNGLDAVNFGMTILGEYCEKEGVSWKAKLML